VAARGKLVHYPAKKKTNAPAKHAKDKKKERHTRSFPQPHTRVPLPRQKKKGRRGRMEFEKPARRKNVCLRGRTGGGGGVTA